MARLCWSARCSARWLADRLLAAGWSAGKLAAGWLARWQAGWLLAWLAGWLAAGWLAAWLAGWLLAGSLAGWLRKMAPEQKIEVRWKSELHCHLILILGQNQTSIHEEYFSCGTFSFQRGFVNEKHVQRDARYKKSRCSRDGVYLRTSIRATSGEPST